MLRILAYHRVAELPGPPWLDPAGVSATPANFARQMSHLAQHYRVVSMMEVLHAVSQGTSLPQRSVLITFDDAYIDFAENAWPVLRRLRLPATLFVPTAHASDPRRGFWWDRLYQAFISAPKGKLVETPLGSLSLLAPEGRRRNLRAMQNYVKTLPHEEAMSLVDDVCAQLGAVNTNRARVLSWDHLRQLQSEGLTLGSHTRTHAILTRLPLAEICAEIKGSQQDIAKETGAALPIFCYPNGDHDDVTTAVLRAANIVLAFTTLAGRNTLHATNLLRLRRTDIRPRTSLPLFRFRLLRAGAYLDAWRTRSGFHSVRLTPSSRG